MSDQPVFPLPEITPHSQPHWDGLRQEKFLIQRCAQCGKPRHYPRVICSECYAADYSWLQASGKATVHSWTVAHHAYHPAFKAEVPYVVITADLVEGVRMLSRFQGSANIALRIGLPVLIGYTHLAAGITLPVLKAE
jgi:uncharacterized OB-fold protein